jgi:hypothetical protein
MYGIEYIRRPVLNLRIKKSIFNRKKYATKKINETSFRSIRRNKRRPLTMKTKNIKKAEKETKEAYEATFNAAKVSKGKAKENLTKAVVDLERAETEIEESEEAC